MELVVTTSLTPNILAHIYASAGLTRNKQYHERFRHARADSETEIPFGTGKSDYCDLSKNGVFIEQEYSRFEMFFRDFFRFLLLHDERKLDIGILITYDDSAFNKWGTAVSSYKAVRSSLGKLIDFLEGKYSAVVRVPIWYIGIE